jgi:hypothetical protein
LAEAATPRNCARGSATLARLDVLADALDPKAARKRVVDGPVVDTQLIRG